MNNILFDAICHRLELGCFRDASEMMLGAMLQDIGAFAPEDDRVFKMINGMACSEVMR